MEFSYRAGEERHSSFSSTNGYFAEQALRAGLSIGNSGFVPPTFLSTEALLEELRRERIREELLAREIAHKRMLEEDLRRELEIERLLAMRRLEEEERSGAGFLLEDERALSLGMPPRFRRGMDESPASPRFGGVEAAFRRKSMVVKTELSKLLSESGVSGSRDNKPSVHQVS